MALHGAARGETVLTPALTRQLLHELATPCDGGAPLASRGVTRRERQVLGLLADGRRTAEVAFDLTLSRETVRGHVKSALRKLGVRTLRRRRGAARRRARDRSSGRAESLDPSPRDA